MGSKQLYVLGNNMGTKSDENAMEAIMENRKIGQP